MMAPMVDKLIKEGIAIERLETWHNQDNAAKLEKIDRGYCGGVPFFINTDSGRYICGGTDEKSLRAWAAGTGGEKADS